MMMPMQGFPGMAMAGGYGNQAMEGLSNANNNNFEINDQVFRLEQFLR